MPKHIMGKYYAVEKGVYATLRGFAASTGLKGCKMVHLDIFEDTEHLFHPEKFPEHLSDIKCGKNPAIRFLKGSEIAEISEMPQEIKDRYRLGKHDYIVLRFLKPETYKIYPPPVDGQW